MLILILGFVLIFLAMVPVAGVMEPFFTYLRDQGMQQWAHRIEVGTTLLAISGIIGNVGVLIWMISQGSTYESGPANIGVGLAICAFIGVSSAGFIPNFSKKTVLVFSILWLVPLFFVGADFLSVADNVFLKLALALLLGVIIGGIIYGAEGFGHSMFLPQSQEWVRQRYIFFVLGLLAVLLSCLPGYVGGALFLYKSLIAG